MGRAATGGRPYVHRMYIFRAGTGACPYIQYNNAMKMVRHHNMNIDEYTGVMMRQFIPNRLRHPPGIIHAHFLIRNRTEDYAPLPLRNHSYYIFPFPTLSTPQNPVSLLLTPCTTYGKLSSQLL